MVDGVYQPHIEAFKNPFDKNPPVMPRSLFILPAHGYFLEHLRSGCKIVPN